MSMQDVSKVPLHYTCTDSHLRDGALIRMRRMYLGKFIDTVFLMEELLLVVSKSSNYRREPIIHFVRKEKEKCISAIAIMKI